MANERAAASTSEPSKQAECLYGEWQQPINRWIELPDSIHNDDVAREIGMRGGTIPGTVHLAHFRPLLERLWGEAWQCTGSLSLYYTYATTHKEDVRAVVRAPDRRAGDEQLECWVEMRDGTVAAKGTIAAGRTGALPYVRAIALANAAAGENRILAKLRPGQELPPLEKVELDAAGAESGLLLNPTLLYSALAVPFPRGAVQGRAVGFFGATEIVLHAGPLRSGTPYRKTGRVACVGVSAKTEFAWIDSWLWDAAGKLVAEMRHMTRWMKVSSPLWQAS
jgi:hypothetical protein